MMQRVAVIVGAGPGNGAAFASKFLSQGGYKVAVLSRNHDTMVQMAASLGTADNVRGYACDVTSDTSVQTAFANIQKDFGLPIDTVVYNAGSGGFKPWNEWSPTEITQAADINAAGLFRVATEVYPQFQEFNKANAGAGCNLLVVGAGAATRGRPMTVGFAAGKAAQRSVAQSLARAWGPEKMHVSLLIIDGVVDLKDTRTFMADKPDDFFLKPADIAEAVFQVVQQKQSAWTFEFDVRPFGESW